MNSEKMECGHDMCECMVTADLMDSDPAEAYCSDSCAAAEETEEGGSMCNCGHPPCDTP
jgi:hypothetical protein